MKRQILADAIGNLDDDILGNYFSFKENLATKRLNAKQRRLIKAVSSLAACFCVACICVFAVIMNNNNTPPVVDNGGTGNTNSVVPGLDLPSADEIFWPDSSGGENGSSADGNNYVAWNGKKVDYSLSAALSEANDDSLLWISVSAANFNELLAQHVYQGKSYEQNRKEYEEKYLHLGNLCNLLRVDGLWIITVGERIRTEGEDNEEIKNRYYELIEHYGEELLNKYIVDGELLTEKLEADIEYMDSEVLQKHRDFQLACIEDFNRYHNETFANSIIDKFSHIEGHTFIYRYRVNLIITKETFKNMEIDEIENFVFGLVEREDGYLQNGPA